MTSLQIGNIHGVAAVGSQAPLLASVTADGVGDNTVVVDRADELQTGLVVDIIHRSNGTVAGSDRIITAITDVASVGVATTVAGVAPVNEIQTLTEGGSGLTSFTLTYAGQTTASIDDDADAAAVQAALEALSNIAPGDVAVTGGPLGSGPFTVTFGGTLAGTNVAQMTSTPTGGTGTVTVATSQAGVAAVNEQQTVTVVADGGTFTVTGGGETTDPIPYNDSADTFKDALVDAGCFAAADITVTKASNVFTIEYVGSLAAQNVSAVTADGTFLKDGAVTVTYSGADVDPTNAYGLYAANTYDSENSSVNTNGGFSDTAGFDITEYTGSLAKMRSTLFALDPQTYSESELNKMTMNDMLYAIRLQYAEGSLN